ncbi:pentatricopeptide repeat-containing protein [Tanacetum coccineum]
MDPPDDVNMPDLGAENGDELGDEIGETVDNEDVVQIGTEEEFIVAETGDEIVADIGATLDNKDVVQKYIEEEVIAKQKTLDKGKGVMKNEDPSCGSDSDSDSETDQENQMYMYGDSESEESLKSGGAEGEEEVEGSDNDQNDSFDDEGFVTPKRMFDIGISDTVKEHEQDMNALMRRIKGNGCELKDPFTMIDKTEKYPIYDEATHWKLKKPKLGEKFVNVDQFKECLTYHALANGFNLWYETSSKDRIVAKCGHRKEVIKDPSKGKQIQYKKFPTRDPTKVDAHSVCPWRCYRKMLRGVNSFEDHYGLLRSYAKAIADSNVGSTIKVGVTVNPDEKTYFDRFYVCLKGLKEGWKDGNNQIYHVAWAIVTVENKDNWSWFLSLLGDDLDLPTGCCLTLISDQHKGLIEAVKEVMPYAEHRQCARHIYEGFRKQYSRVEFRQLFWATSKASYPQLAFFREGANCKAIENGFSECFNAVLHVIRAGESKFEVRKGYDAFTVDEVANTCSCRMWQILSLPCVHAVACIFKLNKMVEPYVPECFKIEMFKQEYTQFLKPVEGITFWPDCSRLSRILGPLHKKMLGRPKKKKIRASHESQSNIKISRSGLEMTCHNCWQKGHNKKGCKNESIPKTPKVKWKVGRPKKTIPTKNTNVVDDEDLPRFVNNSINEFYKAPSNNYVVFNDGVRINLRRNWNTNKRGGKLGGTCFVKMRRGTSSRGGLVPTERLGRIEDG